MDPKDPKNPKKPQDKERRPKEPRPNGQPDKIELPPELPTGPEAE